MHNQELVDRALKAIRDVFDDTSVDLETAIENLTYLSEEINILIEALESDLR